MAVSNRTIRPTSKPEGEDAPSSGLPAPRRKPQQDVETFAGTAQQYVNRYSGASRNEQLQQKTSAIRSQGQAERKAETTNNDFKALQSGKPEEVQDWRQIAAMTAGLSAEDSSKPMSGRMRDTSIMLSPLPSSNTDEVNVDCSSSEDAPSLAVAPTS